MAPPRGRSQGRSRKASSNNRHGRVAQRAPRRARAGRVLLLRLRRQPRLRDLDVPAARGGFGTRWHRAVRHRVISRGVCRVVARWRPPTQRPPTQRVSRRVVRRRTHARRRRTRPGRPRDTHGHDVCVMRCVHEEGGVVTRRTSRRTRPRRTHTEDLVTHTATWRDAHQSANSSQKNSYTAVPASPML